MVTTQNFTGHSLELLHICCKYVRLVPCASTRRYEAGALCTSARNFHSMTLQTLSQRGYLTADVASAHALDMPSRAQFPAGATCGFASRLAS